MDVAAARHREAVMARIEAELRRGTRDLNLLHNSLARWLNDSDVRADPEIQARVRSLGAEMEIQLREDLATRAEEEHGIPPSVQKHVRTDPVPPPAKAAAQPPAITPAVDPIKARFDDAIAHLSVDEAQNALAEWRVAAASEPASAAPQLLQRAELKLDLARRQVEKYRAEISSLENRAVTAARGGDEGIAAGAIQRLQAINALRPTLLSAREFVEIRERVTKASESFEHHETMKAMLAREREVATEVLKLASRIRQFHRIAHQVPREDAKYIAAEKAYLAAVNELRTLDGEWFAALIVELEDFVEELHDADSQVHVDHFLESLRKALRHARHEAKEIETERHTPPPSK